MKFSLVAILPAVLWTVIWYVVFGANPADAGYTSASVVLFLAWVLTAAVLTLYWAARIVRFALRGSQR